MMRAHSRKIGAIATLLLSMSSGAAKADKNIEISYEVVGDCVTEIHVPKIPTETGKKKHKITWKLKKIQGPQLTKGTWKIERDATKSDKWCEDVYQQDHGQTNKLVCEIQEDFEYSYNVTWSAPSCPSKKGDPVIIFKDGSTLLSTNMLLAVTGSALLIAFYFAVRLHRLRRTAS